MVEISANGNTYRADDSVIISTYGDSNAHVLIKDGISFSFPISGRLKVEVYLEELENLYTDCQTVIDGSVNTCISSSSITASSVKHAIAHTLSHIDFADPTERASSLYQKNIPSIIIRGDSLNLLSLISFSSAVCMLTAGNVETVATSGHIEVEGAIDTAQAPLVFVTD